MSYGATHLTPVAAGHFLVNPPLAKASPQQSAKNGGSIPCKGPLLCHSIGLATTKRSRFSDPLTYASSKA